MLVWGDNSGRQLGILPTNGIVPTFVLASRPALVELPESSREIFVGQSQTLVLADSGRVYVWGGCESGPTTKRLITSFVSGAAYELSDVKAIALSQLIETYPNVLLKNDGTVWLGFFPTSAETHHSICDRTFSDRSYVHQLELPIAAVAIATGGTGVNPNAILALTANNTLWGATFSGVPFKDWSTGNFSVLGFSDSAGIFHKLDIKLDTATEVQQQ